MRTTLSIDADLIREVKVEAARRGVSMTSVIEEALRAALRPAAGAGRPDFPVSARARGVRPGFSLDDPEQLHALL